MAGGPARQSLTSEKSQIPKCSFWTVFRLYIFVLCFFLSYMSSECPTEARNTMENACTFSQSKSVEYEHLQTVAVFVPQSSLPNAIPTCPDCSTAPCPQPLLAPSNSCAYSLAQAHSQQRGQGDQHSALRVHRKYVRLCCFELPQ